MSAVLLGQHEHNTPEWDGLRSRGLGGSEIAAVVGLSPWVSRFALWHRKRGTIGKQVVNAGMNWGHRLEDAICQAFAESHDMLDVEPAGTYCHADRPWQLANVDRLLFDDEFRPKPVGLLEVKTAHQYDSHEWGQGPEDIPPYYRCQVLWYMDVLGVPEAHLAVLIGGSDYREYQIPYVADEAEWLREQGREFWQSILDGTPPDLDGSDATYQAVRELHPEINGEDVEITEALWLDFVDSKNKLAAAEDYHRRIKSEVLDLMGEAKRAVLVDRPVLRRQPNRSGVSLVTIPQPKTKKEDAA